MLFTMIWGCASGPLPCNGSAALCPRSLSEVTLAVAHNAMGVEDEDFLFPNQPHGYEAQAAAGVRGFMLDVLDDDGVPALCHADCSLGAEPLAVGLSRIASVLDAYPRDVFVLVIQDEIDAPAIVDALVAAGLDTRAIVDPDRPLGDLLDGGAQILITHEGARPDVPDWYHATYDLAWDNDYAASTVEDFGCDVLRGDPEHPIFLLNHFLTRTFGSADLAADANQADVVWDHVRRCEAASGDRVNWLAVDFYDVGSALALTQVLNQP